MDKFDPVRGATVASSPCIYNKQAGVVSVTRSHLAWRSTSAVAAPKLSLPYVDLKGMHVNAATSEKCLLKISLKDEHQTAHLFQFTGAGAQNDREKIKVALAEQLQKHRAIPAASSQPQPISLENPLPVSLAAASAKLLHLTPKEIKIRGALLSRNKELLALHKELVLSGMMSEEEFWDTRQPLLALEAAQEGQQKGMSSAMVSELRPSAGMGGEIKYTLTPSIIHSIFIQYPALRVAYQELVGSDKSSEKEFWTHYFSSKLFSRDPSGDTKNPLDPYIATHSATAAAVSEQASNSSVATSFVHPLLNIPASVEDHPTTLLSSKTEDTKTASLVRKLNRHSELVLKTNLIKTDLPSLSVEGAKKISLDELIEMEDLNTVLRREPLPASQLELKDHTFYLTSLGGASQAGLPAQSESQHNLSTSDRDTSALKQHLLSSIASLSSGLDMSFCYLQTPDAYERFNATIHKRPSQDPDAVEPEASPESLHFYNRTNEILRHFWSSSSQLSDPELRLKNQRMLHLLETCSLRYAKMHQQESQVLESLREPLLKALEKGTSLHPGFASSGIKSAMVELKRQKTGT